MLPREYIQAQLNHEETSPVPYFLKLDNETLDEIDRFKGNSDWRNGLVDYIKDYPALTSWPREELEDNYFRDIWGSLWRDDKHAFHLEEPGLKEPSLDGYDFPTSDKFLDASIKEASRKKMEAETESFRIIQCGWGILERTWHIRGFENALMDAAGSPDFYGELLDKITDLFLAFIEDIGDLPAEGIKFGDNWGFQTGVIIGPDLWRKLIKPRWAKIYDAAHAKGLVTISHCDGCVTDIMDDIIEIGLDVLESVQPEAMDLNELKTKWGDKIVFWGGLGSQSSLDQGTPESVKADVQKLCKEMGKGGGYILGPSKPPQKGSPIENAAAAVDAFIHQGS